MNTRSKTQKSIGYMVNKTHQLNENKQEIRARRSRFKKQGSQEFKGSSASNSNANNILSNRKGSGNQHLLSASKTSENQIEMNTFTNPPEWVDIYENINRELDKVKEKEKKIVEMIKKRTLITFDSTNEKTDQEIQNLTSQSTQILRASEAQLQKIDKIAESKENESENDKKIRQNLKIALATQIQQLTMSLRKQQKNHLQNKKQFDASKDDNIIKQEMDAMGDQDDLEMQEIQLKIDERDEEITSLVESINELAFLFKKLSQYVVDQGTLIDRIDYNIDQTYKETKQGVKHLQKAKEHQDSPMARRCICLLMTGIIVLSLILTYRYTKEEGKTN